MWAHKTREFNTQESRERLIMVQAFVALAKMCHGLWRTIESPTLCFCTPLEREEGEGEGEEDKQNCGDKWCMRDVTMVMDNKQILIKLMFTVNTGHRRRQ